MSLRKIKLRRFLEKRAGCIFYSNGIFYLFVMSHCEIVTPLINKFLIYLIFFSMKDLPIFVNIKRIKSSKCHYNYQF